jgi:tRNA dimethylallyltransferase
VTHPHALIVAGPTCSGKSALAIMLAQRLGGTIVNADSMQVYPAEEAATPHALYGVRPAAEPGSVAWWRDAALAEMAAAHEAGRLPILCGGTGLYFLSLTQGIAEIPPPGDAAREQARALLAKLGPAALHAQLAEHDPETAVRIDPADSQRIARAMEVWLGTGKGLSAWQAQASPPAPWRFTAILLDPQRTELRDAITSRFGAMLAAGALEEVRALLALGLDPALPAMRAHGVPELAAHLRGEIALAEAERRATLATGQYTKRQATWFRHHELASEGRTHTIHARIAGPAQLSEQKIADMVTFIREGG